MEDNDYPAFFRSSDHSSNESQDLHLNLIRLEYGLLILAAIFSMSQLSGRVFYTIYALVFVALLIVLVVRAYLRPVQRWYKSRALAESVKTLTWRFMMSASPFDGTNGKSPKQTFIEHLRQLLRANLTVAEQGVPDPSSEAQITARMDAIAMLSWMEKRDFYREHRIRNQRGWYRRKSMQNRSSARTWILLGVGAYSLAGTLTMLRIWYADWSFWPIEPIIVFASSIIGWMQLKRYGELAAAYQVTAQEIGILEPGLDEVASPQDLSEFVNDAERAFSREHTMWLARHIS